ncbi:uL15 family ribosomal protein [Candidatus Gracilibacteria bacterium]|nr:uL15 family ribosomal protein [Candidatus Gracilibacteria bacterium]MCF7898459.1 uL15 family ribosomal protein [Candidatus Paceibacterota bacterium]
MQIHEIKRDHANKKSKLVGRGGTRGKTSGKGGKGQTARAGHRVRPAMRDIIKKLPKLRGHGKNRSVSVFYRGPEAVVNVGALNVFSKGDIVNPTTLIAHNLIALSFGKNPKVKILGNGELTLSLSFERCNVSDTAREKIEKAGGTITIEVKPKPQSDEQLKKIAARQVKKADKKANKGKTKSKAKK